MRSVLEWERRAKFLTKKINGKKIKEVAENLPSMASKEISKQRIFQTASG